MRFGEWLLTAVGIIFINNDSQVCDSRECTLIFASICLCYSTTVVYCGKQIFKAGIPLAVREA